VGEVGGTAVPGDVNAKNSGTWTRDGSHWIPAECDVSIRPGWFWHEQQSEQVKTAQQLIELGYLSVGRGASLLPIVPRDRRGSLDPTDVAVLRAFGERLRRTFFVDLAAAKPGLFGRRTWWREAVRVTGRRTTE
jgi:alpha-L-fucosidase